MTDILTNTARTSGTGAAVGVAWVACLAACVIACGCGETVVYEAVPAVVQAVGPAYADGASLAVSVTLHDLDGGQSALVVEVQENGVRRAARPTEVQPAALGPYGLRRRQPETVWVRFTPGVAPSGADILMRFGVLDSPGSALEYTAEW
jgi:hypothetical protein